MPTPCSSSLLALIETSLAVDYLAGAVTPLPVPYTTGWRQLPCHVVAQLRHGRTILRFPDGREQRIKHREAVLVQRSVTHCFDKTSRDHSTSRWAHLRVRLFGGIDALDLMELPLVYPPDRGDRIGDLCEKLARTQQAAGRFVLQEMASRRSLEFQLVALLAEHATLRPNTAQILTASARLTKVYQALHEHPENHFTLAGLARMAGLSSSRFHALFRQSMGMPPLKYLQHLRMDRARTLLLTTDLSLGEISDRIGLQSAFYFSRLFKKTSGFSPQQYRRQSGQGSWQATGLNPRP